MSSSSHSAKSIESEVKSLKTLLREVSQAAQLISFRQLENETKINDYLGEESLRTNEYHQPSPRRARKERQENLKEALR